MISGIIDTITSSIDSVGDLLAWVFVGAVILAFLKSGNNKGGSRSSGSSSSGGSSAPPANTAQ